MTNPIEIYQTQNVEAQVEVRFDNETVWLSLQQMADMYGRDKSVISRHLSMMGIEYFYGLVVANKASCFLLTDKINNGY
ncbi:MULTISPECIES: hypothetical protein [unclassified Moraxella]|uniref:hypothetical protein n=1 Tax=unclassified Moraxella TaxID=2685852 RepID=UPI003AF74AE1